MKKQAIAVLIVRLLCSTSPLAAIKPSRTFIDYLNRIEWNTYYKNEVHRSMTRNAVTAFVVADATSYLAKKYREQNTQDTENNGKLVEAEGSSDSSRISRIGWFGGATLIAACITAKSALNCNRLWNIIKKSTMPPAGNQQLQAALTQGMQPDRYYWVSKPLKNMF